MTRRGFRDAPPGSYVCEEGWLIVGDEAWTVEEWNTTLSRRDSHDPDKAKYAVRYSTDLERRLARNASKRRYRERLKAGLPIRRRRAA